MPLGFIFLLTFCFYSIPYYYLPHDQTPIELYILLLISIITVITGFVFYRIRKFEDAELLFDTKSLNIISKKHNVTIPFKEIQKFSSTDINAKLDKISFQIITKNSRKFEIKADKDLYEGLITLFPEKQ